MAPGAAAQRLGSIGFPSVHHQPQDFHALVSEGRTPTNDLLLTNPPYSADHLPRLFAHCIGSERCVRKCRPSSCGCAPVWAVLWGEGVVLGVGCRPWALLVPWFVVRKPWFRAYSAPYPPALGLLRLPVEIDRLRGSSTRRQL